MCVLYAIRYTLYAIRDDTRLKSSFAKQGKVVNLGHLDFDIVSDFDIRISDFNHSGCFMQNKPNFRKSQMNVNKVLTKDYENKTLSEYGKNKPNTNPNKANLLNDQMNVTSFLTKEYENISNFTLAEYKPNTNPIKPNLVRQLVLRSLGEGGFKRSTYAAGNCFQHSMRTRKIRRLGTHTRNKTHDNSFFE